MMRFVIWDQATLDELGAMETIGRLAKEPLRKPEDDEEKWREMELSWEARSQIWQRGGKGYWSKDGESKIVWGKSIFDP